MDDIIEALAGRSGFSMFQGTGPWIYVMDVFASSPRVMEADSQEKSSGVLGNLSGILFAQESRCG